MMYAIYKTIKYTAEEINASIDRCEELPGIQTSLYADGWVVAEPEDMHVEDWHRNKDDYRIECLEIPQIDAYDRVIPKNDGKLLFIKD